MHTREAVRTPDAVPVKDTDAVRPYAAPALYFLLHSYIVTYMRNTVTVLFLLTTAALVFAGCEFFPEKPGEKYALVYGIANYGSSTNDLTYTDNDAIELADLLEQKGYQVKLRTSGEEPDPELKSRIDYVADTSISQFIDNDLQFYRNNLHSSDTFLFYFSGHGVSEGASIVSKSEDRLSDDFKEYIVFFDGTDAELFSDDAFYSEIKTLPTLRNIVIIDACNSGGFIGQVSDVDTTSPEYYDENETRDGSLGLILNTYFTPDSGDIPPGEAVVLTAAGEREVSLEAGDDYQHGIFTYYLLRTPQNDPNGDGIITTAEAYGYIRYALLNWWNPYYTNHTDKVDLQYYPRISGGPVDYVLFEAD